MILQQIDVKNVHKTVKAVTILLTDAPFVTKTDRTHFCLKMTVFLAVQQIYQYKLKMNVFNVILHVKLVQILQILVLHVLNI